jgi:hypothetical protein
LQSKLSRARSAPPPEESIAALREELRGAVEARAAFEAKAAALEKEAQVLKEALRGAAADRGRVVGEIERLGRALEEAKRSEANAVNDLAAAAAQAEAALRNEEMSDELRAEVLAVRAENERLRRALEEEAALGVSARDGATKAAAEAARVEQLEDALRSVSKGRAEVEIEAAAVRAENERLQVGAAAFHAEIERLQEDAAALRAEIERLQDEVAPSAAVQDRNERLEEELRALRQRLEGREATREVSSSFEDPPPPDEALLAELRGVYAALRSCGGGVDIDQDPATLASAIVAAWAETRAELDATRDDLNLARTDLLRIATACALLPPSSPDGIIACVEDWRGQAESARAEAVRCDGEVAALAAALAAAEDVAQKVRSDDFESKNRIFAEMADEKVCEGMRSRFLHCLTFLTESDFESVGGPSRRGGGGGGGAGGKGRRRGAAHFKVKSP